MSAKFPSGGGGGGGAGPFLARSLKLLYAISCQFSYFFLLDCAHSVNTDPESFVRGGPTLTLFFNGRGERGSEYH